MTDEEWTRLIDEWSAREPSPLAAAVVDMSAAQDSVGVLDIIAVASLYGVAPAEILMVASMTTSGAAQEKLERDVMDLLEPEDE